MTVFDLNLYIYVQIVLQKSGRPLHGFHQVELWTGLQEYREDKHMNSFFEPFFKNNFSCGV